MTGQEATNKLQQQKSQLEGGGDRQMDDTTKNNHPSKTILRGVKHYTTAQKGCESPSLEVYKTQLDKVLSNLIQLFS